MSNEIVIVTPSEYYKSSTDAATLCREIVKATAVQLTNDQNQKKYVTVEGWQAIVAAHKCGIRAGSVERVLSNKELGIVGGWLCRAEVVSLDTGQIVSVGEGFLGEDEPVWCGGVREFGGKKRTYYPRPEYAKRAMAQTRAVSRAARAAFGYVVTLIDADLGTTPAEEMPGYGETIIDAPQIEKPIAVSEQTTEDIKACLQGATSLERLAAVFDKHKQVLARLKQENRTSFDEIMAIKDAKKAELAPEKSEYAFDEETLRQDIKIAKDIFGNFETIDCIESLKQQEATSAQLCSLAETIKTQGIRDYVVYNMVSPEHFRQQKTTILSELDVFLLKLPNAGGLYEK